MIEAIGVKVFASGKVAEQVTVDEGAKSFSAVDEVAQAVAGEEARLVQAGEGGEGDAVSAVELAEIVKEFGFEVRVGALGLGLRQGMGAYSFVLSHISCLHAGGVVRARSVLMHRALPVRVSAIANSCWRFVVISSFWVCEARAIWPVPFVFPEVSGNGFSCRWRSWAGVGGRVRFRLRSRGKCFFSQLGRCAQAGLVSWPSRISPEQRR
jgi:hypothetical protein